MIQTTYDYKNVYLIPRPSIVNSRDDVDLSVQLLDEIKLELPIISSPMKGITNASIVSSMCNLGGIGIIHRFQTAEEMKKEIQLSLQYMVERPNFGVAIGLDDNRYKSALDYGACIICIDVANGYLDSVKKFCQEVSEYISTYSYDCLLMSGNVVTIEGVRGLTSSGVDLVRIGIGTGCLVGGTRILMSNGIYKNIEQIVPGDRVINMNGIPVTVKRAICTGFKETISLKNNSFYKDTLVTPDHKYFVGDLNNLSKRTLLSHGYKKSLRDYKCVWKPIGKIKQDIGLVPHKIFFELPKTFEINLFKRSNGNWRTGSFYSLDAKLVPTYELGYIFGTFLGDGHALNAEYKGSHIGAVNWSFGKDEDDIVDKLNYCLEISFGKQAKVYRKKSILDVRFYYKPFADYLMRFGKRIDKHLPEDLLVDEKQYLRGIYDGLVDSDGNYESGTNRITFVNTSTKLIELFMVLNNIIFGYFPLASEIKKSSGTLGFDVSKCNQSWATRTLIHPSYRIWNNYQITKLETKENFPVSYQVYDLEIDDDTHSFIAENSVVHNSLCSTRQVTGVGVGQINALQDCRYGKPKNVKLVADGGIRNSGDAVKALASGADLIMVGSLLGRTYESSHNGIIYGMASRKLQEEYYHSRIKSVEGLEKEMTKDISIEDFIREFTYGMRSAFTYLGASNIQELQKNAVFVEIK